MTCLAGPTPKRRTTSLSFRITVASAPSPGPLAIGWREGILVAFQSFWIPRPRRPYWHHLVPSRPGPTRNGRSNDRGHGPVDGRNSARPSDGHVAGRVARQAPLAAAMMREEAPVRCMTGASSLLSERVLSLTETSLPASRDDCSSWCGASCGARKSSLCVVCWKILVASLLIVPLENPPDVVAQQNFRCV